ncbi:MAG: C39 family peptidase [Vulcanimicrobiaceae bacterium]
MAVAPAREAIVSWNTPELTGRIDVAIELTDGRRSSALDFVEFGPSQRRSLNGHDAVATLATDVVRADGEIAAVEIHATVPLTLVAVSTPNHRPPPRRRPAAGVELAVPERSQYLPAFPVERGWCSPTTLSMLLEHAGIARTVPEIVAGVYDATYAGTGNWVFSAAYAGSVGLFGVVLYVRDLDQAAACIRAGVPLALSIGWSNGELPGAPLEASAGHLVVLRGFSAAGDPIVNDPANAVVRTVYPRAAFERVWIGHGGIAYAIAPADRTDAIVALVND